MKYCSYLTKKSINGILNVDAVKSYPNDLRIYGFTNEIGTNTKTLDNPHTIISLNNILNNIYDESNVTSYKIYIADSSNTSTNRVIGSINTHAYSITVSVPCKPNTTYTINRINTTGYQKNPLVIGTVKNSDYVVNGMVCNEFKEIPSDIGCTTFTTGKNDNLLLIQAWAYNTYDKTHSGLMVFEGIINNIDNYDVAENNNFGILLHQNDNSYYIRTNYKLMCVDNIRDYIYKDNDIWKLYKQIEEETIDFTDGVEFDSTNEYNIDNFILNSYTDKYIPNKSICSHFNNQITTFSETIEEGVYISNTSIEFRINHDRFNADVELFKDWLLNQVYQGTPLVVQYELSTPEIVILPYDSQSILNNFILVNDKNLIYIEDMPDIIIQGYIN